MKQVVDIMLQLQVQVIQDKVPPSTHLLKGYLNVPHYIKKDMIACFKRHINLDEGM
jgi:hypothetical protein